MRLGVHTSIEGKIYKSVDKAKGLGCQTMQIFSRNPRGWTAKSLDSTEVIEFRKRRAKAGIYPLFVHIPYIINLASPKDALWKMSIKASIDDVRRSDSIGAEYFVTHLGSHMGRGEEYGIKRFSEGLNRAIDAARPRLAVLFENTAGAGNTLGYNFRQIGQIISNVEAKEKIGICLDTCHAFAAGYNIRDKKGLSDTLSEISSFIGIKRLKLIHINDSKAGLGARIDRHEHIGRGGIGLEGFRRIVNHPDLRDLSFILETPKMGRTDDARNLRTIRKLVIE